MPRPSTAIPPKIQPRALRRLVRWSMRGVSGIGPDRFSDLGGGVYVDIVCWLCAGESGDDDGSSGENTFWSGVGETESLSKNADAVLSSIVSGGV